ncbi:hypothetical protein IEQ34_017221 [Dendrobium chrysotoxum]|uniref:Uncharacterized protein n=1 Tax=Dendrobium chrysotoxum TaxID=161865 RepID=A0AAV7GBE9_DENCH|nr:hypothetical protein IEQ34_017221 [Dendrobium chrysotoxum]
MHHNKEGEKRETLSLFSTRSFGLPGTSIGKVYRFRNAKLNCYILTSSEIEYLSLTSRSMAIEQQTLKWTSRENRELNSENISSSDLVSALRRAKRALDSSTPIMV